MKVIMDFDDYEPWSGACETYYRLKYDQRLHDFEELLEELYPLGIDMVKLNELLWFDSEWILESLGYEIDEEKES